MTSLDGHQSASIPPEAVSMQSQNKPTGLKQTIKLQKMKGLPFMNSFAAQISIVMVGLLLPLLSWGLIGSSSNPMFPMLSDDELTNQLKNKDVLIVGGTEGIGAAVVHELTRRGSHVTVTGASKARHLPKHVDFVQSNLSTMRGAMELGVIMLQGRQFDTVIFSGGFVTRPLLFLKGEGDAEDLQTSYISRFIILNALIKNNGLKGRKRVYILAYPGDDNIVSNFEDQWFAWPDYKDVPFHVNTLLYNDALVKEAARRFPDLKVFGVNPGFISPEGGSDLQHLSRSLPMRIMEYLLAIAIKTPTQYVRKSLVQILAAPDLEFKSGSYISDRCEELAPKQWMSKEANRVQVWDNSETLVYKALG
jgi:hypothetical protein